MRGGMAPSVHLSPHRSLLLPTGEGVRLVLLAFIITPALLNFLPEEKFLCTTISIRIGETKDKQNELSIPKTNWRS